LLSRVQPIAYGSASNFQTNPAPAHAPASRDPSAVAWGGGREVARRMFYCEAVVRTVGLARASQERIATEISCGHDIVLGGLQRGTVNR